MRPYLSSSTIYKGWAVYDFSELLQYEGIKITSGYIKWHSYYYYATQQVEFWTLPDAIPYDGASGSTAQTFFDGIGGKTSVKLGTNGLHGTTSTYYSLAIL